jgi:hypothetical protein
VKKFYSVEGKGFALDFCVERLANAQLLLMGH